VECRAFEIRYEAACPPGGPAVPQILAEVDREYAEFAPVLKLAVSGKSLVESYGEVTTSAT